MYDILIIQEVQNFLIAWVTILEYDGQNKNQVLFRLLKQLNYIEWTGNFTWQKGPLMIWEKWILNNPKTSDSWFASMLYS